MSKENWLPIPGYEGLYAVSDRGQVMSMNYASTGLPQILVPLNTDHYPAVKLSKGGKVRRFSIHSLVATAFIGPRASLMQVNHIDGVKTNNFATNLEYVTGSENRKHAFRIGLQSMQGEKHNNAKLNDKKVREIRALAASGMPQKDIASRLSVGRASVSDVVRKKSWAHVLSEVLQ